MRPDPVSSTTAAATATNGLRAQRHTAAVAPFQRCAAIELLTRFLPKLMR